MHALVRFAHNAADDTFTTAEIHAAVIEALGCAPARHTPKTSIRLRMKSSD
jgi:hypothetical protein